MTEKALHDSSAETKPSATTGFWEKVRHAFAVDPKGGTPLTEAQEKLLDGLSREVVRRGMALPAITFLEMSRPLNFVTSQAMRFFHPFYATIAHLASHDTASYDELAQLLERRDSLELLGQKIDAMSSEQSSSKADGETDKSTKDGTEFEEPAKTVSEIPPNSSTNGESIG